jgi:hypothetical protein
MERGNCKLSSNHSSIKDIEVSSRVVEVRVFDARSPSWYPGDPIGVIGERRSPSWIDGCPDEYLFEGERAGGSSSDKWVLCGSGYKGGYWAERYWGSLGNSVGK